MHYVYMLYSLKDHMLYIGFSDNLRIRVVQHIEGKVRATKHRLPLELIYYEAYKDKRDATKREYFLKSGRGRELIKSLLKHSLPR
ncbi:TPA: excinuclease ABC subunit C [Patescibacteria group bacterium]|uniref:GIY-YIG domain-containing protein n=1 Tax=Candidatus Gottesmanbacteria bacterium GW2011_GWA1_43_11 TaxID=1618436 RepID=A0A0G1CE56_9BACT|nr:MAG: hypothetical protein UV59_C0031G0004 [Candidatus Gottesmanbacteria bacterium GW2011_GWA1_43_11]HCS79032.1 excinuclease ABC subunit C [Patescibacteria group bacterium]